MYQLGRKVATIIADGEVYWFVEKSLPASILPDEWFNVAFRWKADLGVQVCDHTFFHFNYCSASTLHNLHKFTILFPYTGTG